jgi:1-phosphatidylinositol-3-phosphate 5-kinase
MGNIGQQAPACSHSLHRDHIQYFSNNGVIVSFMYTPVEIWEVKLPQLMISLKAPQSIDKELYTDKIKKFSIRGYEVYAKIHEKLANLSTEDDSSALTSLKKVLNRDQLIFKYRIEVVYTLLASDEVNQFEIKDAMFMVYKELADSIELWGPRLNEVATQIKNASKNEPSMQIVEDLDEACNSNAEFSNIELDLDGGTMTRSTDELQNEKKDKIDKKTIKRLLSAILPSSSDQNPLQSPYSVNEHFCLPIGQFPILVHDQDLSSIIAYSLMSYDYKKMLENLVNTPQEAPASNNSPNLKRKNLSDSSVEVEEKEPPPVSSSKDINEKSSSKKQSNHHIEVQFQDSTAQFTCKSYFAKEFDELRAKCLTMPKKQAPNDEVFQNSLIDDLRKHYARSLSHSLKWEARGGKSGSKFSKTNDDRFILKEMSKQDIGEFEKFATHYFEHINDCINKNLPTLLAKIVGVYKVVIKKKDFVSERAVLIIENLFADRKITNKYDLKGSERNRLVDPTLQSGETVLLDENLIKSK